jgi:hypothetical protein
MGREGRDVPEKGQQNVDEQIYAAAGDDGDADGGHCGGELLLGGLFMSDGGVGRTEDGDDDD